MHASRAESPSPPPQTLPELFDYLTHAAGDCASQYATHQPVVMGSAGYRLGVVISHIRLLKAEFERPPEMRSLSVIRSSWAIVSEYGREFGLFKSIPGEPELRRTLLEFLNTGLP